MARVVIEEEGGMGRKKRGKEWEGKEIGLPAFLLPTFDTPPLGLQVYGPPGYTPWHYYLMQSSVRLLERSITALVCSLQAYVARLLVLRPSTVSRKHSFFAVG